MDSPIHIKTSRSKLSCGLSLTIIKKDMRRTRDEDKQTDWMERERGSILKWVKWFIMYAKGKKEFRGHNRIIITTPIINYHHHHYHRWSVLFLVVNYYTFIHMSFCTLLISFLLMLPASLLLFYLLFLFIIVRWWLLLQYTILTPNTIIIIILTAILLQQPLALFSFFRVYFRQGSKIRCRIAFTLYRKDITLCLRESIMVCCLCVALVALWRRKKSS